MSKLEKEIAHLKEKGFWGQLIIIFKDGVPSLLEKRETVKID